MGNVRKKWHLCKISKEIRADMAMWIEFLKNFNGRALMHDEEWDDAVHIYTDASTSVGFGAVFGDKWIQGEWGDKEGNIDITVLELYAVAAAVFTWGENLRDKKVVIHSDNMPVVEVLNDCSSKSPNLMKIIRPLVLQAMRLNIVLKAIHIPGVENVRADALSRSDFQAFWEAHPTAKQYPCRVPMAASSKTLLKNVTRWY